MTTPLWLPPLVAVAVASLTATLGISGAFLLLPFQVSVLGYTAPGVSATNLVYNLVAIPAGARRIIRVKYCLHIHIRHDPTEIDQRFG